MANPTPPLSSVAAPLLAPVPVPASTTFVLEPGTTPVASPILNPTDETCPSLEARVYALADAALEQPADTIREAVKNLYQHLFETNSPYLVPLRVIFLGLHTFWELHELGDGAIERPKVLEIIAELKNRPRKYTSTETHLDSILDDAQNNLKPDALSLSLTINPLHFHHFEILAAGILALFTYVKLISHTPDSFNAGEITTPAVRYFAVIRSLANVLNNDEAEEAYQKIVKPVEDNDVEEINPRQKFRNILELICFAYNQRLNPENNTVRAKIESIRKACEDAPKAENNADTASSAQSSPLSSNENLNDFRSNLYFYTKIALGVILGAALIYAATLARRMIVQRNFKS